MFETDEAFYLEDSLGTVEITGVHHYKCPVCGEITFGPKHLAELSEYKSRHRSAFA